MESKKMKKEEEEEQYLTAHDTIEEEEEDEEMEKEENEEEENEQYIVAFHFQSFGGVPLKHGFTDLQASLASMRDGKIIDTFKLYAKQDGYEKEDRCIEEFWLRKKDMYTTTTLCCKDSKDTCHGVVAYFIDWIQHWKKELKGDMYLITDCAAYDIGILKAFAQTDILYVFGECTEIIDIGNVFLGAVPRPITNRLLNVSSSELVKEELKLPPVPPKHEDHYQDCFYTKYIIDKWVWYNNAMGY